MSTATVSKFNGLHVGQPVTTSGYPGTVITLCEWSQGQTGLVEVRLRSGVVCVDAGDVKPITEQHPDGRWFITIGHAGFNSPANNRQGYASERAAVAAYERYAARPAKFYPAKGAR